MSFAKIVTFIKEKTYKVIFFIFCFAICFYFLKHHYKNKLSDFTNPNFSQVLTVAISPDYPPIEFIKEGKMIGFDLDFADLLSKKTGFKFEFKQMSFPSVLGALNSQTVDIAISGLGKDEKRENSVTFSESYFNSKAIIIFNGNSDYTNNNWLNSSATIGAQRGTLQESYLKSIQKKHNFKLFSIDDTMLVSKFMEKGDIDIFFTEELQGAYFLSKNKHLSYLETDIKAGGNYIAFSNNFKYKELFNKAIKELKAEGVIDEILSKWKHFDYDDKVSLLHNKKFIKSLLWIMSGVFYTIKCAILSFAIGLFFAFFILAGRISDNTILKGISGFYISVIRGVPLMLQLMLVYFVLPKVIGIKISVFSTAIIAFSVNSSAYISEILRSGLNSIHKGQFEVCKSMNIKGLYLWKDILIPQILKNSMPSLINEVISLVKESSIISIIGGLDITRRASIVSSEYYSFFTPIVVAGFTYYVVAILLEKTGNQLLRKFIKY